MKISEILDAENKIDDMIDSIILASLPSIDKFIDNILDFTNNFNTPIEVFNTELLQEMMDEAIHIKSVLAKEFDDDSRWIVKINEVIQYLSGNKA
jgi:hypothetical protein